MSDLLNQASLVYIPSGYKEDTAYSVIPTDGSGDLTFTRASDGTRVNSQGLVERVPWNLVKSSGDISTQSTYWASNQGGSTTQNAAVAPDGTTTAAQITSNGATFSGVSQSSISVSAVPYTYSCYLKATSGTPTIRLTFYDGVTFHQGNFTITSEWVRYSFTFTPVAGTFAIYNTCTSVATWLAWGAQINEGSTAKPYFPTIDRLNVPRLDYSGGCPSLLLEPQRTNLLTYSEQFDNAAWAKSNCTVTANQTTSPDGTTTADLITATSTSHALFQGLTVTASTAYTFSFYVKRGTMTNLSYRVYDLTNLSDIISPTSYYSQTTENGWARVTVSFTTPVGCTSARVYPLSNSGVTGTVYFWGAQVEAASYPTSYIPTTSASVTRVADAAYKTGISSLIGQTEGTLFVEVNLLDYTNTDLSRLMSLGTVNDRIVLLLGIDARPRAFVNVGGSIQVNSTATVSLINGLNKVAFAYKQNDFVIYLNGVSVLTDTSGTVPTCSNLYVGTSELSISDDVLKGRVSQAVLFKTRISNTDLASLTTL